MPSKNARHPAARPAGLIHETRRFDGRADQGQRQDQDRQR